MMQKTKNSVPILRCCITKTFPPTDSEENENVVFRGARLTVNPGDVMMLKGTRGAGKSTLIKILGGLMEPSQGYLFWGDDPIYIKTEGVDKCENNCTECADENLKKEPLENHDTLRGEKVAFIFQDPNLVNHFSAVENVAMPLILRNERDAYEKAKYYLGQVGLDKDFWKRDVKTFSGGQKQSVNIARALASKPDLIFADEPFSHLDDKTKKSIWDGIHKYKQQWPKISMIIITHNEDLINEQGVFSPSPPKKRIATHICVLSLTRKDLLYREITAAERPDRDKPLKGYCPRCDKEQKFLHKTIGDVIIDICPGCNGIWLDDGELDELWLHMDKFMDQAVEENVLRLFR
ncbi:MAG: ATP-binding cassette domain-containing protein [Proteobacteria bacterium]|nr:ATP-binding cassette domain-containing protein [Pseudomonadota bacterium]MBU4068311.1 ATP-binding cassette domain-containing protein [Pseudomonadota bacterium]